MMTDERLDQLIYSSLEWRSGRAAATQPSVRQATSRLASRLGPSSGAVRPRLTLAPATVGALNLVTIILLLLAMAAAVVVGALLLRESRQPGPGPFGFASYCGVPLQAGVVASFSGARSGHLYADGSLVSDPISPQHADESPLTRTEYVEQTAYFGRKLTTNGVELVLDRLNQLELAPGCFRVQTEQSTGSVYVRTAEGLKGISWYPYEGWYGLLRRATPQEEPVLARLSADLGALESWLPADAWVDPVERQVKPDRWLVYMTLTDSIQSTTGYDRVVLPGGVAPVSFGAELGVDLPGGAPGATSRCGVVDRAEALALARSMDAGNKLSWIGLVPAFPDAVDCDWLAAETRLASEPEPTPIAAGELASVDPCSFITMEAADAISTAPARLVGPDWAFSLGVWSRSCQVVDETVMGARAGVSVHPSRIGESAAREMAHRALGGGTTEEVIAGRPVWLNECLATELPCWWAIAASSEPYFVVIQIDARDDISPEAARAFVETVLNSIGD